MTTTQIIRHEDELNPLQRKLVDAVRSIPKGHWSSWGDIGEMVGIGARQVANELMNIDGWMYPSFRIRMADGSYTEPDFVTGYCWVTHMREAALREEGCRVRDGVAPSFYRWKPVG